MTDQEIVHNKRILVVIFTVFLVVSCVLLFAFIRCICLFPEYDLDRLELRSETLTFNRYDEQYSRSGWYYIIYCEEYEKPLRLDSVTSKRVDQENLNKVLKDATLNVMICQNFDDICEISSNGIMVLTLSDYIGANQDNLIIGMILCIMLFLCVQFLAWVIIRAVKPNDENEGLGKIRLEYWVNGNVIRVYHSGHVCSLVINDQIFDQHHGIYGAYFCLKGIIGKMKAGGRTIRVEAKMGFCHMRLYCDGKQVAKKFMLFG